MADNNDKKIIPAPKGLTAPLGSLPSDKPKYRFLNRGDVILIKNKSNKTIQAGEVVNIDDNPIGIAVTTTKTNDIAKIQIESPAKININSGLNNSTLTKTPIQKEVEENIKLLAEKLTENQYSEYYKFINKKNYSSKPKPKKENKKPKKKIRALDL